MLKSSVVESDWQTVTAGTFVNREGIRLLYTVSGAGPLCIFPAPGWGPSVDYAFRTLKPLERHLTMVYLDTRGTGRSQRPPSEADYRWEQFAADVDDLRQHLGQDSHWIMGHSWASLHALHYALAYGAHVAGLILVGGLAATDEHLAQDRVACIASRVGESRAAEMLALLDAELGSQEEFQRNLKTTLPLYFHTAEGAQRFAGAAAATRFSAHAWRGRAACQLPVDLTGRLHELRMPTLIVVGAGDLICPPAQSQRLHQGIAGSELLRIEDAGHFPWIESPQAFFRGIARFVSSVPTTENRRPAASVE